MPSVRTTVVVRGRPNPLQAAGRDGGPEADGDQAAAREGTPDHAAERDAVLASGAQALTIRPCRSLRCECRRRQRDRDRQVAIRQGLVALNVSGQDAERVVARWQRACVPHACGGDAFTECVGDNV